MQLVIRQYRPSDKDAVLSLFSMGIQEQIHPSFYNVMSSPVYLAITLTLSVTGYLLGSVLGAVVVPGAWVGFLYYCCYEVFAAYVRETLRTDMQDIPGRFLSRPDDCFWVAEAVFDGSVQLLGMAGVLAKGSGKEKFGEMVRLSISPLYRRMGLGSRLVQTALDFCKERGFSKVVLETSSIRTAAVALYKKLGFNHVFSHREAKASPWVLTVANIKMLIMEKQL